jgi:hypothetical protein
VDSQPSSYNFDEDEPDQLVRVRKSSGSFAEDINTQIKSIRNDGVPIRFVAAIQSSGQRSQETSSPISKHRVSAARKSEVISHGDAGGEEDNESRPPTQMASRMLEKINTYEN